MQISQLIPYLLGLFMAAALMVVALYAVHKMFRRGRESEPTPSPAALPSKDAEIMVGAVQQMTQKVKLLDEQVENLTQAARVYTEQARIHQEIFKEMPVGLIVFDSDGFLAHANPAARTLLGIDSYARRRYPEVFGPDSPLVSLVTDCLERGTVSRSRAIGFPLLAGEPRTLSVTVAPVPNPSGGNLAAFCLLVGSSEPEGQPETTYLT